MSTPRSVAVVGATGGAGATRLVVETAAVLARDGRDVAVFDAAFATQGLAQYVPGRVDVDATRLLTDDAVAPSEALVDLAVDAPGRVAACPVRASFTELADAKTASAAERLDAVLRETAHAFDHVLVDVPPVAANQHVAAVTAVDRVAVVAPDTRRGADALPRVRDRLRDLDAASPDDLVVANRAADDPVVADPAVTVPTSDITDPTDAPASDAATGAFPSAVAALAERAFDVDLDVDLERRGVAARLLGDD